MQELLNLPQTDMKLDVGRVVAIILIAGQKRIQMTEDHQMDYVVALVVD